MTGKTDTKSALLNSAERAVRSMGFDGFSYTDLAREVGIQKASIHYHFPTKAELALVLMQRYTQETRAQLAAIDAVSHNAGERLMAQIDRYGAALSQGTQVCLCVAFSIKGGSLAPPLLAEMVQFRRETTDWLQSVFEQGQTDGTIGGIGPPAEEASATLAMLEGAHLAARTAKDTKPFDDALRLLKGRVR